MGPMANAHEGRVRLPADAGHQLGARPSRLHNVQDRARDLACFQIGEDLGGVKLNRVELCGQLFILCHSNTRSQHDPLTDAGDRFPVPNSRGDGVDSPVDEHTEPGVALPIQPRISVRLWPLALICTNCVVHNLLLS